MALADTGKAVGAVTRLLQLRLQSILNAATPAMDQVLVTVGRPGPEPEQKPSLNLFLYELRFDASLRNYAPDPGQVAPLWLVLRYLLTAFDDAGESDSDGAHDWLGQGMGALQDMNFLTNGDPALTDSPEPLKLSFEDSGPELLSRLMQGEGEHLRCSVSFQVRPVMIARAEPPAYSLLVGVKYADAAGTPAGDPELGVAPGMRPDGGEDGIRLRVIPSLGPQITAVEPASFEAGDTITVTGSDLHLAGLGIRLGGVKLLTMETHPDRIICGMPTGVAAGTLLSAGSHPVALVETMPGAPPRERTHGMVAGGLRPRLDSASFTSAAKTLDLGGALLGTQNDAVSAALYRDGAVVQAYHTAPVFSPGQTGLRFTLSSDDIIPRQFDRVIVRVNGQQARSSPSVTIT